MARRKNVKRIDPRYFLHETVLFEQRMSANIAKQLDQIVLSATKALRGILESGLLSASRDPEARAAVALRPDAEAPRNVAGGNLEGMITQYVDKLDEAAALQLGRGGSSVRGGEAAASLCGEALRGIPPCPDGEEVCALMRNAVGYLACLEQGDGGRWLEENGLAQVNQKIYSALNDKLRNTFQKSAVQEARSDRSRRRNRVEEGLEEGCPFEEPAEAGEAISISEPGMEVQVDDISQLSPEGPTPRRARPKLPRVRGLGEVSKSDLKRIVSEMITRINNRK